MHTALRGSCLIVLAIVCSQVQAAADLTLSKSVVPETPAAGEPVEFNIAVGNTGPDAASDIHVTELLPEGLAIPTGLAAFVSQGTYDAITGDWALGDLAASGSAVMTLPALVNVDPQPPCLVNEAAIEENAIDPGRTRKTSLAAVRNGVNRCVDLEIPDSTFTVPQPICSNETNASLDFNVRNNGPHEARNAVVVVTQSPASIPGLHFTNSDCGPDALRCELGNLAPGAIRVLQLQSNTFHNNSAYTVSLTLAATTSDVDYFPANGVQVREAHVPRTANADCGIPGGVGAGAGCFIATAAWGQPWDENVLTLRRFRDRYLMDNAPGRAFVHWYYRISPPIAAFIAKSPGRRAVVRVLLTPLVEAIRHPVGALLVLCCIPAAWTYWRRRRRRLLLSHCHTLL